MQATAALLLVITSGALAQPDAPLPVFVSILPQKQIVERIGGDAVKVDVLVRPGQDVHVYEPTPSQVVALTQAKVFFRIGMPFEERLVAQLGSAAPHVTVVDTRRGIALRHMVGHHHHHQDVRSQAGDETGQAKRAQQTDPHIWTSPRLIKQQAVNVRDALIGLKPDARERFEAGYAAYARELDALDADLHRLLIGKKVRSFMVFHPSWGYLASDYGLEQVSIEVEGKEPSPRALAQIIERAKRERIRVIFVQPQISRRAADQVARAIGAEVVEIDPLAEDVVGNLRRVGQALASSLR